MPKLFGLNILAVLVASVAFYLIGFLWYGVLFQEAWVAGMGYTDEMLVEADQNPVWMVGGFLITVMQVIGVGLVMRWKGATAMGPAVNTALLLWLLFGLPFACYAYFYSLAHSQSLLLIDASHLLVGWVASAAILSLMKA